MSRIARADSARNPGAGLLDRRVTFRKETRTKGVTGQTISDWESPIDIEPNVPAGKLEETGGETAYAAQVWSTTVRVYRIRYRSDFRGAGVTRMRLYDEEDGLLFDIAGIEEITKMGRRRYMRVACAAVT